jgi:hypothetical protein
MVRSDEQMLPNPLFPEMRYVPAGMLRIPGLRFNSVPVETNGRLPLGRLAGVLVDPVARRLRYLVVDSSGWFARVWRLVPFSVAVVDTQRGALRVDDGGLNALVEVEPDTVLGRTEAAG